MFRAFFSHVEKYSNIFAAIIVAAAQRAKQMQQSSQLRIYSLFPLAFLLQLNRWWSTLYFLVNAVLFIYKGASPSTGERLLRVPLAHDWFKRRRVARSAWEAPARRSAPHALSPSLFLLPIPPFPFPFPFPAANDFPYPSDGFASPLLWEVVFLLAFVPMEAARLWLATSGNMKEDAVPLALSGLIAVAVVTLHVYYVGLQTYVLMLDVIINTISLIFVGVEVLAGVCVMFFFQRFARF